MTVTTDLTKPAFAVAGLADLALEQVKDAPAAVKTLPARVAQATEQAGDLYTALALRGQRLVTQIRHQPATEAAIDEGREAVRKAEAAAVAARNSVRAGEKAVVQAAETLG